MFTQKSGKQRPKYRVICNTCKKDRGYKMLQNAKTHPNCTACARKLDSERVSIHWKNYAKNNPSWNKGLTGIFSEETKRKIGIKAANRNYSDEQKVAIRDKKRMTFAKKYGHSSLQDFDIAIKIKRNLRARLNKAVVGNYKSGSAVKDLGCSIENFKKYLESKWQSGMTWENCGRTGWQIDHIVPLCKFDLTNAVELKKACHYSNLQPMWWKDNLNKRLMDGTFE
jgi:hypothetical protein